MSFFSDLPFAADFALGPAACLPWLRFASLSAPFCSREFSLSASHGLVVSHRVIAYTDTFVQIPLHSERRHLVLDFPISKT